MAKREKIVFTFQYSINGKLGSLEEWIEYIHRRHAELMNKNNFFQIK